MALSLYLTQADFAISSVCDARFFHRFGCQMQLATHSCTGMCRTKAKFESVEKGPYTSTSDSQQSISCRAQSVICVRRVCIYAHEAHHSYSTPAPHSPSFDIHLLAVRASLSSFGCRKEFVIPVHHTRVEGLFLPFARIRYDTEFLACG